MTRGPIEETFVAGNRRLARAGTNSPYAVQTLRAHEDASNQAVDRPELFGSD